jgi:sarcosine oxidase subunit beta
VVERAEVLVVGAGVNGLGLAHRLAERGLDDVVVLEKKYPMYGGSGRNGGGVRAQWASLSNLTLARDSIPMWKDVADEIGLHTWFRQSGYLMLARDDDQLDEMRGRTRFQRAHGVPTHVVGPEEAGDLAPCVDMDRFVGGAFCPEDAVIFPWPVVNGLLEVCRERGVDVRARTPVTDVTTEGGRIARVRTPEGEIAPDTVVNCAGAWSSEIAGMAGVELPNTPVRHQIFVTEALTPMLDPMVVDVDTGLYVSQDGRGEFVAGLSDPEPLEEVTTGASAGFLPRIARELTCMIPDLGSVNAMRQWSGCYDVTPDHVPNLGPHPELANFLQLNGFSGHGFMVSPRATQVTADLVLGEEPDLDLDRYAVDRFERGTSDPERMAIG